MTARLLNIQRLLLALVSLLGLLSLGAVAWKYSDVNREAWRAEGIRQGNRLADITLEASIEAARERGITASIIANPAGATDAMRAEMRERRSTMDKSYQNVLSHAAALLDKGAASYLQEDVDMLARHYEVLKDFRGSIDRRLEGGQTAADAGQWLWVANAFIQQLVDVRHAATIFFDDIQHAYYDSIIIKEASFALIEQTGRERSLLGAAIARGRPLSEEERISLAGSRAVVEETLPKLLRLARRTSDDQAVRSAQERLHGDFVERYGRLRSSVYEASEQGAAYPVTAFEWYAEASRGINAVVDLYRTLSAYAEQHIMTIERRVVLARWTLVGKVAVVALLIGLAFWVTYRRILDPLALLEKAARTIGAGNLRQPVVWRYDDEFGDLGRAFEHMRVALLRDKAARERAEAETRKFLRVVEQADDIVVITNRDGVIEYVNDAFERVTGYGREEVTGRYSNVLKSGRHDQAFYERLWRTVIAGEVFRAVVINRKKSGEVYWEEKTITPVRDGDGRIAYFVATGRDITERRRVEAQLIQSEKLASIGQLAAGVAHEINNPVGYINSNLGTLRRYLDDLLKVLAAYEAAEAALEPGARGEIHSLKAELDLSFLRADVISLVNESQEGVTRIKRIVRDLKDFSRADEEAWQRADLHQGLDSALNILHNELRHKAEIVKEYGTLPEVECVAPQLVQVFMNLLVNAAQALGERGKITVRTGVEQEDWVWVEVRDTGKGMAPEHLKKIFDPFFTTKPVGEGTGLGLSISYGIVQKHGGRIEVESEVGKGSAFRVWLPVRQSKERERTLPDLTRA